MTILDKFTELRSHLERCRILLDDLYDNREDIDCMEGTVCVMGAREDVFSAINKTIKGIVAHKHAKGILITSTYPKPAKPIKEHVEYDGDAEVIEAEMIEYERDIAPARPKKTIQYHPDPKLNKLMQTAIEMGGLQLYNYIPKFKMETPPMELWDIYEFVAKLREKRMNNGAKYETGVYTHLCEHGTIYVGIARINHMSNGTTTIDESVRKRLENHRNWHESDTRANWTGLFKVLSMIFCFPGDKEDEDLMVQLLHSCLPYTKIRGGQYTGIGDVNIPIVDVKNITTKMLNK